MSTENLPYAREYRAFWDDARRIRFSEILRSAVKDLKLQAHDFDEYGTCYGYAVVHFAEASKIKSSSSTYYRATRDAKSVSDDALTAMLYGIGKTALDRRTDMLSPSESLNELASLYAELIRSRRAPPSRGARAGAQTGAKEVGPVEAALSMIAQEFRIRGDIPKELENRFAWKDRPRLFFHTYRFSAEPGFVQKSFTVLKRPSPEVPLATFRNFVKHSGGQRRSSGIVLPLAQQTVFLGQSDNGSYSKLMVIRNTVVPQAVYRGLLISDEPDDDAIAARFIMKATDVSDSRETNTGKFPLSDVDLDIEDINSIRNRVPFVLEDEVHNQHGKLLSQDEIFQTVGYLMQDSEGFPKLTIREDELFNPAADKFYTFNAALKRR